MDNFQDLNKKVIYEIRDVHNELEELSEDEQEIRYKEPRVQEVWAIKREIKKGFKVHSRPPETIFCNPDLPPKKKKGEDEPGADNVDAAIECNSFYKLGRLVGRGTFGKVSLALHKLTRKVVAVKSISNSRKAQFDAKEAARIDKEYKIMQMMRHRNVVKIFERITVNDAKGGARSLIFMELA